MDIDGIAAALEQGQQDQVSTLFADNARRLSLALAELGVEA